MKPQLIIPFILLLTISPHPSKAQDDDEDKIHENYIILNLGANKLFYNESRLNEYHSLLSPALTAKLLLKRSFIIDLSLNTTGFKEKKYSTADNLTGKTNLSFTGNKSATLGFLLGRKEEIPKVFGYVTCGVSFLKYPGFKIGDKKYYSKIERPGFALKGGLTSLIKNKQGKNTLSINLEGYRFGSINSRHIITANRTTTFGGLKQQAIGVTLSIGLFLPFD